MPPITITLSSPVRGTFRVHQAAGIFDLPLSDRSTQTLTAQLPDPGEPWTLGAIVGPSGSGKSSVARHAFGDDLVGPFDWPGDAAVVDAVAPTRPLTEVTAMLCAVGFSSPPAWVRPYHVLSNGERFRCDLARALLLERETVVFDEFTSVVDRNVARVAAACVARAVRSGAARCKRFVAVTCHYDVLEWLAPDWRVDMATGQLARGSLQRPPVRIEVRRAGRERWAAFGRHHYLSSRLHRAARCYEATWNGEPVALLATLNNPGHAGRRLVHRVVVLPDFQGLGIGTRLLDAVARVETQHARLSIRTGHPGLIRSLKKRGGWRCVGVSRGLSPHRGLRTPGGCYRGSMGRLTVSFEFIGRGGDAGPASMAT